MTAPARPWRSHVTVPAGTVLSAGQCRETAVRPAGRAVERDDPDEITLVLEACGLVPYESGRDSQRYVFGSVK